MEDVMRRKRLIQSVLATALVALSASYVQAQNFSGRFSGFDEVGGIGAGQTGAIYSGGTGSLALKLDKKAGTLDYTLDYSGLGSPVTQAHIHFGKVHVGGGIMVFLCTNLGNGPAGTPACPANGGTVSGTLDAADVVGPAPQNIVPGNFQGVVDALKSNTAYGNIHTTQFPAGEMRAQIGKGKGKGKGKDDDENDDDDE
jgi:hypothetical protein